jgi:hypothetical protein
MEFYSAIKKNEIISWKMSGTKYHHGRRNKPLSQIQILNAFFHLSSKRRKKQKQDIRS